VTSGDRIAFHRCCAIGISRDVAQRSSKIIDSRRVSFHGSRGIKKNLDKVNY
jgi:hypothetical protein